MMGLLPLLCVGVGRCTNRFIRKLRGWGFDGEGKVVRVAGADVPPNGNIKKVYRVCGAGGVVRLRRGAGAAWFWLLMKLVCV